MGKEGFDTRRMDLEWKGREMCAGGRSFCFLLFLLLPFSLLWVVGKGAGRHTGLIVQLVADLGLVLFLRLLTTSRLVKCEWGKEDVGFGEEERRDIRVCRRF